jgi:hypothetical protein
MEYVNLLGRRDDAAAFIEQAIPDDPGPGTGPS